MKRLARTGGSFLAAIGLFACGLAGLGAPERGGLVSDAGTSAGNGGPPTPCTLLQDCPVGYSCELGLCIPPENETQRGLENSPPVASPHYVYALNPSASSVARIDPRDLTIEAIPVGPNPVALFALPGEDAAVVLCFGDGTLWIVDSTSLPSRAIRLNLRRRQARLVVSAEGAFAVAFPDANLAPSAGAEGIISLIDLKKAREGRPVEEVLFEKAAGYRVTDAVFSHEVGQATRLHVFAKSTVSTFDLLVPQAALPRRLNLPASMSSDINTREVVSSTDGVVSMLRSSLAAELVYFDGQALTTLTLPEIATDLDLVSDGSAAVAALRALRSVAYIELPQDVANPAGIQLFSSGGPAVGQVALPPAPSTGNNFALVYTTAQDDEAFARIDLPSGLVTPYALEKRVAEISISPDTRSALVIHRPTPAPQAQDPYERAVDLDQGYTVVDIGTGYSQLKRTGTTEPVRYAFSPIGGFAGVALRDDAKRQYALDAVNLGTLVVKTLALPSAPLFAGTVPPAPGVDPHRVFVSQHHPAGRISVIELDTARVRMATGFTLNAEIQ